MTEWVRHVIAKSKTVITGFRNFIIPHVTWWWDYTVYMYVPYYYSVVYGKYYYQTYYYNYYYYLYEPTSGPGSGEGEWQAYVESVHSYARIDSENEALVKFGLPANSKADVFCIDSDNDPIAFTFLIGTEQQGYWNLFSKSETPPWFLPQSNTICTRVRQNDPASISEERYLYSGKVGNYTSFIEWPDDPSPVYPIFTPPPIA
jgi:hypothetical protein